MNFLFEHALLLTQAMNEPLPDMCIGIADGKVAFISKRPPEDFFPQRRIDCRGSLLMPGFVNAHTHSPLSFLRSFGEGLSLQTWLESLVWPYEAHHTAESCYWGALLNAAECIRSGVTCVCDMYIYGESVADAYSSSGLRALVTPTVTDDLVKQEPDLLIKIVELAKRWSDNSCIQIGIAPHAVYTCNGSLLSRVASLAEKYDLPIHVHVSETLTEQEQCVGKYGMTPLQRLANFGLISRKTLMAHCVWFTPEDIQLTAQLGATIVHCPRSNLKLGSGIAPIKSFLNSGIPVALGTDSSASNNNQDILEELRFASLLQKGVLKDPSVLPPKESLFMATSAAGHASGFSLGKLAPQAPADLILVDRTAPHWKPGLYPSADLLYAASASDVKLTMVNGKILYEDGVYTSIDMDKLYATIPQFYPTVSRTIPQQCRLW